METNINSTHKTSKMRTNVIKVLVLYGMSVRELRLKVKRKEYNKAVLKDAALLMSTLMIEKHLQN
jgi:hypothetical protein